MDVRTYMYPEVNEVFSTVLRLQKNVELTDYEIFPYCKIPVEVRTKMQLDRYTM